MLLFIITAALVLLIVASQVTFLREPGGREAVDSLSCPAAESAARGLSNGGMVSLAEQTIAAHGRSAGCQSSAHASLRAAAGQRSPGALASEAQYLVECL